MLGHMELHTLKQMVLCALPLRTTKDVWDVTFATLRSLSMDQVFEDSLSLFLFENAVIGAGFGPHALDIDILILKITDRSLPSSDQDPEALRIRPLRCLCRLWNSKSAARLILAEEFLSLIQTRCRLQFFTANFDQFVV